MGSKTPYRPKLSDFKEAAAGKSRVRSLSPCPDFVRASGPAGPRTPSFGTK
jgi:hypothetical protein